MPCAGLACFTFNKREMRWGSPIAGDWRQCKIKEHSFARVLAFGVALVCFALHDATSSATSKFGAASQFPKVSQAR